MLANFSCFSYHLLTFYKLTFTKHFFMNTIRVPNSIDPDQDRQLNCKTDVVNVLEGKHRQFFYSCLYIK